MLGLGSNITSSIITDPTVANSYSLDFNGTDEYGSVSSLPTVSISTATVSLWAKLDASSTNSVMFGLAVDSDNVISIFHKNSDNTVNFQYKGGGSAKLASSTLNVEGDGNWYHIVLTVDTTADELKGFVNGSQVGTTTGSLGTWSGTPSLLYIARNPNASNSFFHGKLDEVSLFNVTKTPAQVTEMYNSGKPTNLMGSSGLIGWWRMEENTGTTVADSSANSNSMTLFNTPTWSSDTP
jgi:hypothetical protein|tara:strand:- start:179 stop:892 length:714 start_codon:yes stop_codon:yes gene_type:complete